MSEESQVDDEQVWRGEKKALKACMIAVLVKDCDKTAQANLEMVAAKTTLPPQPPSLHARCRLRDGGGRDPVPSSGVAGS